MGRHYLTDLADVLRAAGLPVVEAAGWRTRGTEGRTGMLEVRAGIVHHTATPNTRPGVFPTWDMLRDGRDLNGDGRPDGPLSQLTVGRDGTWGVIAAGRAWHPGKVTDSTRFGADHALGIEMEDDGLDHYVPPEQYASLVAGCAALGAHYGITWWGHKEVAAPRGRKIDPVFDMATFRRHVATYTPAAPAAAITQEDDTMTDYIVKDPGRHEHYVTNGQTKRYISDPKVLAELTKDEAPAKGPRLGLGLEVRYMSQYAIDRIADAPVAIPAGATITPGTLRAIVDDGLARALAGRPDVDAADLAARITEALVDGVTVTGTLDVKAAG